MDELDDLIKTLKEQRELFKQERTQDKEQDRLIIKQLTDDIKALSRENAHMQYKIKEQNALIQEINEDYLSLQIEVQDNKKMLIMREE